MNEYKGIEYNIERRESDSNAIRYDYEFHLTVDGEEVMTATALEQQGYDGPEDGGESWATHLERYAIAFIDGVVFHNGKVPASV